MTTQRSLAVGLSVPYASRADELVALADQLPAFHAAGAQTAYVSEVWGFDAVSLLGRLSATAPGMGLASNILPVYTRTPALVAMTAAGLDALTGGRFTLGLGASGPQVVEGFHGVPHDAPLARTREVVEVCRAVWRREPLDHQGRHYSAPLSRERGGSGVGKPLRLLNAPVRERVPVMLAALGPRNVALAAEVAEEWAPFLYRPESTDVWDEALADGLSRRDAALGPLGITVPAVVAVDDDVEQAWAGARRTLALYLGGMGARHRNFYADLARRYGFGEQVDAVQDLYLAGRVRDAEAAVPDELVRTTSLAGPRGWVAERLALMAERGVTTVVADPAGADHTARLRHVQALAELADDVVPTRR